MSNMFWNLNEDQPLITRYRPRFLKGIWGNEKITESLMKQTEDEKLLAGMQRGVLFYGPAGVGKSTYAMTLARAVGCPAKVRPDNTEYLENVRHYDSYEYLRIREHISEIYDVIKPTSIFACDPMVYIFDEAHYITDRQRSMLLRAMEFPISRVFFFFCTTDPKKLLKDGAFKTRCMLLEIEPLSKVKAIEYISWVCKRERKNIPQAEVKDIAVGSGGVPREILARLNDAFTRY